MGTRQTLMSTVFWVLLAFCSACNESDPEPRKGQSTAVFNPDKEYGTMTDIDGNQYRTIQIGGQTWMAENLRVTHFRNGDPVPAHPNDNWYVIEEPAYCTVNNNNDPDSIATFGLLYNGHVVADERQIAPEGWRVPTRDDVFELIDHLNTDEGYTYIGGNTIVGGMLREAGTTHWQPFNRDADNSSGLTLVPAGYRQENDFLATTSIANLFTSTYYKEEKKYYGFHIYYTSIFLPSLGVSGGGSRFNVGNSIRCIKE